MSGEDWERLSHSLFVRLIPTYKSCTTYRRRVRKRTMSWIHRRDGILKPAHQRNDFAFT